MLATDLSGRARLRGFGAYNAVATAAGSLGALAAGGLGPLPRRLVGCAAGRAGLPRLPSRRRRRGRLAAGLSPAVEVGGGPSPSASGPVRSVTPPGPAPQPACSRSIPSAAGFVVQSFIAYWLTVRFGASIGFLGVVFFAVGSAPDGLHAVRPPPGRALRAPAHHGVHPPAVQRGPGRHGLRPQPGGGRGPPAPAGDVVPDGRPHPPGLRHGARRSRRSARRRRRGPTPPGPWSARRGPLWPAPARRSPSALRSSSPVS